MTGDLIETFHERRSGAWFWKQVLIVTAIRVLSRLRHHWPQLDFAVASALSSFFLENPMRRLQTDIPWWERSWPWSMLVFDGSLILFIPFAHLALLCIPYSGLVLPP